MKIHSIQLLIISFFISLNASAAIKRSFLDSPARAIWLDETKLHLTLPTHLNVNGNQTYYLKNDFQNLKVPLNIIKAHGQSVDFEVPYFSKAQLLNLITGPILLVTENLSHEIIDETSLQLAGLLDKNFFYEGSDLGARVYQDNISVKLWAPTAISIDLLIYNEPNDEAPYASMAMTKNANGVWESSLDKKYLEMFYLYNITVYYPQTKSIEKFQVTDPYSFSLSRNSTKSQIVDMNSDHHKPLRWDEWFPLSKKPVIYEAHLRDLTIDDTGVEQSERGTYLALTRSNSKARKHLSELAKSGMSYIHFLPLADFASVNEDKSTWSKLDLKEQFTENSDRPQTIINNIRSSDGYNWGYDPYHYFAPEGSYSVNPQGASRILELRSMIQSLNSIGLNSIIDVVFNHTYSSDNGQFSVFNKIVPLYFYRLDHLGNIANSSCCSDTASENKMMEKMMIDSVIFWARNYKISGFRFDLMSFHTKTNLINVKKALSALTISKDGIDGKKIIIYGEGWNFGSLVNKNYQDAMTQLNSFGLGIGQFNDRLRDAVRGGTTDSNEKSDQGFVTGLFYDFNHEIANRNTPTDINDQKNKLNFLGDVIKIGLAGNLRDFFFKNSQGGISRAGEYYYRGAPVAYAAEANETVNYVSAHDGYSLFDAINAKSPFYSYGRNPAVCSIHEKVKMVELALGLTLFSQGIPFIEGGSEILRSKSGDVDSYDSGDWFNHLNFDYNDNNWGRGLPPSFKNYNDWSFWSPRLGESRLKPSTTDILESLRMFRGILAIRQSSTLFNYNTPEEMREHLSFIDNDKETIPGLIAMRLINEKEELIILFNMNRYAINFEHDLLKRPLVLHPFLNEKVDNDLSDFSLLNGRVKIPARSIVVLLPNEQKSKKK